MWFWGKGSPPHKKFYLRVIDFKNGRSLFFYKQSNVIIFMKNIKITGVVE